MPLPENVSVRNSPIVSQVAARPEGNGASTSDKRVIPADLSAVQGGRPRRRPRRERETRAVTANGDLAKARRSKGDSAEGTEKDSQSISAALPGESPRHHPNRERGMRVAAAKKDAAGEMGPTPLALLFAPGLGRHP